MGKLRCSDKLTPGKKFCVLFLADPGEWAPGLSQAPFQYLVLPCDPEQGV